MRAISFLVVGPSMLVLALLGCGRGMIEMTGPDGFGGPPGTGEDSGTAAVPNPAGDSPGPGADDPDAPEPGAHDQAAHDHAAHDHPVPVSTSRDEYCDALEERHVDHDHPFHADDPDRQAEHHAATTLLRREDASHLAVRCGAWSDPNTWDVGEVPGDGADVFIPFGIGVTYDVPTGARLHYVMVDGYLEFATDRDTDMRVDTLVGGPTSHIHIGTHEAPVEPDVTAQITIVDTGPIDTSADPEQISRGVVLHGETHIHGAVKRPWVRLAQEPTAGDDTLAVAGAPSAWRVGDEVVVVGTRRSDDGNERMGVEPTQDEVRNVVAVEENGFMLDRPLDYDHDVVPGHGFVAYAGNATRNVRFVSENPTGVRGHFMVMHNPRADIRYTEFRDLGRTDRREPVSESNPIGRYPLHFHRTGVQPGALMAVAVGNAVIGSPGWGITHHDSFAAINHNFVFDIVGAGIASEAGNEVGEWVGNLVTSVTGADTGGLSNHEILRVFGPGTAGEAYTNMSRAIFLRDNIAANCELGWSFEGRIGELSEGLAGGHPPDKAMFPFDPVPLHRWDDPDLIQFVGFERNEVFACGVAMRSSHRGSWYRFFTDVINEAVDFHAWRVHHGIFFGNYTWDYTFKNLILIGTGNGGGFNFWAKSENMNLVDAHIENFRFGIHYALINNKGVLLNVEFVNVDTEIDAKYPEYARPLTILDPANVTMRERAALELDPGQDLTLTPTRGSLTLTGTVTDSAGEYPFASYRHWLRPDMDEKVSAGYQMRFRDEDRRGWQPLDDVLATHGALQQDDGSWVMPVVFWIGDRITGHNFPEVVYFPLQGFDTALLEQHRIARFEPPDHHIGSLMMGSHP